MHKRWAMLIIMMLLLLIAGCATYTGVGSETWYKNRIQELELAHKNGDLAAEQYFRLKNEIDMIRQDYTRWRRVYPSYRFGYGYHYYRH